jgi:hypothetical protein
MTIIVTVPLLVLGIDNFLLLSVGHSPVGRAPGTPHSRRSGRSLDGPAHETPAGGLPRVFRPRGDIDTSGLQMILASFEPWDKGASLEEVAELWKQPGLKAISRLDRAIGAARDAGDSPAVVPRQIMKAMLFQSEGQPIRSYEVLQEVRSLLAGDPGLERDFVYFIIYLQGVSGLRRGENDNCVDCRGESACILPILPAAVHLNETGSRLAIRHFSEYLERFPDDLAVCWLLNLAHMTLGEHPDKVDPRFLISLDRYRKSEFDIGKFRDVGHLAGVNRFNQAGGGIMDDFDNDGLLDIVVSTMDPTEPMGVYRNKGNGVFEDRSKVAGVTGQLGGLYCVQTDYNNDGHLDVYVPRGAWLPFPIRPSLLRNDGNGTFTDVTESAGLLDPANSITASWSDYDNDGWLDLFVCCELQPNRLYHNRGDGTFEEVSARAGLRDEAPALKCPKGSAWLDFDNDDYPDLFVNNLAGATQLYHNNRDGTFTDATSQMGINGPRFGFSCWAWDYDNDGWLDIFATSYDRTLEDVVKGLLGQPHDRYSNRLYHNVNGRSFENATREQGLDMVFATMGSNYGDFDNDGFLDMYLGTGEPNLATLIPNRMFKNVEGKRFSEITVTSGTGHLQKGHSVACGDWDRDGDIDLFVETGGPTNGDKFRNILFQNPGQGNHWLTVKLVGKKTNRAAIGARIKVVTAGEKPLIAHRHVSSGSSFGANPLQQTIGLAQAERVALLEIHWPTSGTTQVFRDIAADQAIEVTEFAKSYRPLDWRPIPQPEGTPGGSGTHLERDNTSL